MAKEKFIRADKLAETLSVITDKDFEFNLLIDNALISGRCVWDYSKDGWEFQVEECSLLDRSFSPCLYLARTTSSGRRYSLFICNPYALFDGDLSSKVSWVLIRSSFHTDRINESLWRTFGVEFKGLVKGAVNKEADNIMNEITNKVEVEFIPEE